MSNAGLIVCCLIFKVNLVISVSFPGVQNLFMPMFLEASAHFGVLFAFSFFALIL